MTEITRATALQAAAQVFAGTGRPDTVLAAAETFHAFILTDAAPEQVSSRATTGAKTPPSLKAAPAKPAAAKPAQAPAPAKVEQPPAAAEGDNAYLPTKEGVGAIVAALIAKGAEGRKEAIGLLKKYQATSVSGVKESDYPEFVAEGSEILASLADLTA